MIIIIKIIKIPFNKKYALDAYKNAPNFPDYKYFEDVTLAHTDLFQKLMTIMLHLVRLNKSKGMFKIGLIAKYLKKVCQGTSSLKYSRK